MAKAKWTTIAGGFESRTEGAVCQGSLDMEYIAELFQKAAVNKNGRVPYMVVENSYKDRNPDMTHRLIMTVEGEEEKKKDEYSQETAAKVDDDDLPF